MVSGLYLSAAFWAETGAKQAHADNTISALRVFSVLVNVLEYLANDKRLYKHKS
jgi:hypothetical protein